MENEFVLYEIALALKELGFDEPCFGSYVFGDELNIKYCEDQFITDSCCLAPTFSQAFRWFREKYKLEYHIKSEMIGYYTYIVDRNINKTLSLKNNIFQTYEEAELECLKKLIKIIKNNK